MTKIDLSYPSILKLFGPEAMKEATESRAFLAWFLANYYYLDEEYQVPDSICDGRYDKGIDGIFVNDDLAQIDIFQATMVQTEKTIGDVALKVFAGTLSQFADQRSALNLENTSKNPALTAMLKRLDIANKVEEGYAIKGVFITNAKADPAAHEFLSTHPRITLYDNVELTRSYVPFDKVGPIAKNISFDLTGIQLMEHSLGPKMKMVIAPLLAEELVRMEGIASGELFERNVRQFLGQRTNVNKDIAESIGKPEQHKLFPAFHNGLTILCERLDIKSNKMTIGGYSVVNGCQSLSSLERHKQQITPELRIITKLINLAPDDPLARTITDRANNQNGTTSRDLQSNNPIQTRLQSQIHRRYKDQLWYRIKRGEHREWPTNKVIENDKAARVLLAFDLKEPETCHQAYKLFGDLHAQIFGRPAVDADRIVFAHDIYNLILARATKMKNELFGRYGLTRYLLIYLLREVLELDTQGNKLCISPRKFFDQPNGRKRVNKAIDRILSDIVILLDNEVTRREEVDEYFDYKSELKSRKAIQGIKATIISHYELFVNSGHAQTFSASWGRSDRTKKKTTKMTKKQTRRN